MSIRICAKGLPPKKRTDTSLWSNKHEVPQCIALRKAASRAFGIHQPYTSSVKIRINIYLTKKQYSSKKIGDLDNWVSGVCDALQKSPKPSKKCHRLFREPENYDIRPSLAIGIKDDSAVISIVADKHAIEDNASPFYEVIIDGVL